MLIQFITKNFKMFRDDIIFDMSATDEQTEGYHMRSSAGERVLPIAAIFGANAAGKTTFVQSFAAMKHFVKNSLTAKPGKRIFPTFLTSTDPTEFEIYFSIDDVVFNYGFAATNVIVEEWMNYKRSGDTDPSPVFYRSTDELDISGLPPYCHRNIQKYIKSNILILTLGNALGVQVCKTVAEWFDNAQVISTTLPAQEYIGDKEKALQFIQHFEPQIVDLKIDSQTSGPARIHTIRKGPDGKCYSFPIQSESAGIRKLLALYPAIRHAFDTGSLLVIDDLGAEHDSSFAVEQVFSVIDSRCQSGKPMIVTTNLSMAQMRAPRDISYARIFDRVLAHCCPVRINNQRIRQQAAARNILEVEKLL